MTMIYIFFIKTKAKFLTPFYHDTFIFCVPEGIWPVTTG